MSSMTDRERTIRRRLRDDFQHYAAKCLKIRTKAGKIEPLALNQAQIYLHGRLEEQRARGGKVRALVLKGRQQGISTYIGGRYYWRASHSKGIRVFILTHEQDATNNLFGMVERYHSHCPDLVKPATGAANAKELSFEALESGYAVGTAGAKAVGRPILGRYLFVEVDHPNQSFRDVSSVFDVEYLVSSSAEGRPSPFPSRLVEGFMARYMAGEFDEVAKGKIPVGARIRIMEGEFQDAYATVVSTKGRRIDFKLMGDNKIARINECSVRAA